jgi:hypothetical protein
MVDGRVSFSQLTGATRPVAQKHSNVNIALNGQAKDYQTANRERTVTYNNEPKKVQRSFEE